MSGRLALLFLLAALTAGDAPKATQSTLRDQPRFSCLVSNYRRLSAECTPRQQVCYYTRRMPRFSSDFRPNDLTGRGCDVRRNTDADSCQEYTKGLDTFVRCECGTADCNSHYWHGFAVTAFHHRKLMNDMKEQQKRDGTGVAPVTYASWFMTCFQLMALLWVYYFIDNLVKKYQFQKRAVLMRAVLVARGTQQAEAVQWNIDKPEVTIHNFKTSFVRLLDGFIRYRSLGSLPAIDIKQLHATWLLGRQELHRLPEWFSKKLGEKERLDKAATAMNEAAVEVARAGQEIYFTEATVREEMVLVRRQKRADRKLRSTIVASSDKVGASRKSDGEEDASSARNQGPRNEVALQATPVI